MPRVSVFIATSLDGFIARPDGRLDWLPPFTQDEDFGYGAFIADIDRIVMGRKTFETVRGIEPWPYAGTPVIVLSRRGIDVPEQLADHVTVRSGAPADLLAALDAEGVRSVYLDGGETIQAFLAEDRVDELVVTRVPVLLGAGRPLFGPLPEDLAWTHAETVAFADGLVQSRYRRNRSQRAP